MKRLKVFLNCSDIKSIQDINNKFDFVDEYPQGKGDNLEVSCGQDGSYNELENIYENILSKFILNGKITEESAIQALCSACNELPNPRSRDDFYAYLSKELGVNI